MAGLGDLRAKAKGVPTATATALTTYTLWAVLIIGVVMAGAAFMRPAKAAETKVVAPESSAAAEGFAQLFVPVYLRAGAGTEATLRPYFAGEVDLHGVDPNPTLVVRTAVASSRLVRKGYWSVTVAAETADANGYPLTRFYQVGVLRAGPEAGGLMVATSLPAEVALPTGARHPDSVFSSTDAPAPDDLKADTTARFLSALLVSGDLTRYTAPDTVITPVRPAPFASVEIKWFASRPIPNVEFPQRAAAQVKADILATTASGRQQVLTYSLRLAQRASRWEVAEILPAEPLADSQPDLTPTTVVGSSTTTSTSTSTTTTTKGTTP